MSLRIIQPGMYSSLQDMGRTGHRSIGVPRSGAMDTVASQQANLLAGNQLSDTVIEFTHHGAVLIAESDMIIAHCGGGSTLWVNDQPVSSGRAHLVKQSSLLQLKANPSGYRSYLAVSGGFIASSDLGSSSTYTPAALGGVGGRILKAGDCLRIRDHSIFQKISCHFSTPGINIGFGISHWGIARHDFTSSSYPIRITKGPEWDCFSDEIKETLVGTGFKISAQSNRMGYRLQGRSLAGRPFQELVSEAVIIGTIQVTHEGDLILLMADAQTTGGYPRVAQVVSADLPACAQLKPDDKISFRLISPDEAEDLYLRKERELFLLKAYIQMKYSQ